MKEALSGALHPSRSIFFVIFIFFTQISLLAHSLLQADKVDDHPCSVLLLLTMIGLA
jgi:hypothetical protein